VSTKFFRDLSQEENFEVEGKISPKFITTPQMATVKVISKVFLMPALAKKTLISSSAFGVHESRRQYSDRRNSFDRDRDIDSSVDKVVYKLRTEGRKGHVKDVMNSFRKAQEYLDMKQLKVERDRERKEKGIKEEQEEQFKSVNKE